MRERFSEDVLVRALDFCDQHDMRFGQLLYHAVNDQLRLEGFHSIQQKPFLGQARLFSAENETLAKWIMNFLDRQEQLQAGLCTRAAAHDGPCNGYPMETCACRKQA